MGMVREEEENTYRFLSNFSNIVRNANSLWVLLKELLGRRCVHILDEQRILGRDLCPQVLSHGKSYASQSKVQVM